MASGEIATPTRLGFLYPGLGVAEDDLPWLVEQLAPGGDVVAHVVETPLEEDAHTVEALAELAQQWRLREGAQALPAEKMSAVMWACTSGSFVFGLDGARAQSKELGDSLNVPVSSTSLAFLDALEALSLRRVAIAATYPQPVTTCFEKLLADAGFSVLASKSNDITTAAGAGKVDPEDVLELVKAGDHPEAEVVLVPDTALHTVREIPALEDAVGKPILSANQVTVWQALRLATPERKPALVSGVGGRLFAETL